MNSLVLFKRLSLFYGLSLFAQLSFATMQTTPYLAMHVQPKYAKLSAMPYANPNAPKGGILSQSSLGTFDNLNSMETLAFLQNKFAGECNFLYFKF